ncbi:hypothetical protein PI124_g1690 [Phytophthora idaei]|nr:hypothetical protein PI126_g8471 [Phytophthora idaei]KAG3253717.1 hypothetical protein PI124_g1690 [Phytophthora idaei]
MVAQQVLLQYPDFNQPFDFYKDASQHQLGGVIMQQGNPLGFWSKKCNHAQAGYSTNKKELLSILETLREFRSILWGRQVRVYTDHKNSLEATFRNAEMKRWRLEIEEFGVTMIYARGRDNIVADALPRLPLQEAKSGESAATTSGNERQPTLYSLSLGEIAEAQQQAGLQEGPAAVWRAIGSTNVLVSRASGHIVLPGALVGKVLQTYHE